MGFYVEEQRAMRLTTLVLFTVIFRLQTIGYILVKLLNVISIFLQYTVTNLISALPGKSSVSTAQHAAIEAAVFSVFAVTSHSGGWWSRDMCFL
jgi:hypothetical protein